MKIAHVIEASATGTLSMVVTMSNCQVGRNDVTVIYSNRPDTPENIRDMFDPRVKFIEVDMGPKVFPFSIFNLRRQLRKVQPDVVHCHSSFGGFVGRLASLFFTTKVFYSPHCISFMRKDISSFKKLLFKLFESFACIRRSTYVACSESERQEIISSLPFVNTVLLENAVDLTEFKNVFRAPQDGSKLTVVTVGGIRPQKGFQEFAEIAKACREKSIKFVWVGDGEVEEKRILTSAGVEVTGWKSRDVVIETLKNADLYLSTALWEGMPVSVIEAAAMGLPLILRNCAGNLDIAADAGSKSVYDRTEEAVSLIAQFHDNPEKFSKESTIQFDVIQDRFSIDRFSNRLKKIYDL